MLGNLIGEGIGGLLKAIFVDFLFEVIIQGTGYIFLRYVLFLGRKKDIDPDGWLATMTGIAIWAGMGIAFEALRNDERRRLTHSMRCLRAEEAFILDQRTLTGVPVGVTEAPNPPTAGAGRTLSGWAAPSAASAHAGRPSRITATPAERQQTAEKPERAFSGGLDLAASVFSSDPAD